MSDGFKPRTLEIPFHDLGIQVGDPMFLESLDRDGRRYSVKLVGFVPERSIIVLPPEVDGREVLLKKDRPFTARLAVRSRVCAFRTQVRNLTMQPFPLIHLDYPRDFLALEVRETERVWVAIEGSVHRAFNDGSVPVNIFDLSAGGAGVESREPLGDNGAELFLKFTLNVTDVTRGLNLRARICNMHPVVRDDGTSLYSYGLNFVDLSNTARIFINSYIYEMNAEGVRR